jgi:hypothetical protein
MKMSELSCLFRAEIIVHIGEGGTQKPLRLNADDVVRYYPIYADEEKVADAKNSDKCLSVLYYAHAA